MCAFDKNYRGTRAYPKQIIRYPDLSTAERSFVDAVIHLLENSINVDELVIEQRFADYRTVVYGDWNNDFLRYRLEADEFWVSIRMYPDMMIDYEFNPLFTAQVNKRQLHWKSSIAINEIDKLSDVLIRSATGFFESGSKPPRREERKKPGDALRHIIEGLAMNTPSLQELIASGYELLDKRSVVLAGTSFYAASARLRNGEVLTCEYEKDNQYDSEAVAVYNEHHEMVAHLPKDGDGKKAALTAISRNRTPLAVVIDDGGTRRKRKKVHVALLIQV